MSQTQQITRREFFGCAAVAVAMPIVGGSVVALDMPAKEPEPSPQDEHNPQDDNKVHIGLLMEPLPYKGSARVFCPNPYFPKSGAVYTVHAGKFISTSQPWPQGHPVAFRSIDGQYETIGW